MAYRWHKIHAAWSGLQLIYEEVPWESLIQAFNNRHKKQVQGLHWLAWALNVENLSTSINSATRDIIVSCIQSLLPPTDSQEVIIDYFAFRAKEGKFALNTGAHKLKLRGSTFWYYYQEDGCKLAHLAARVLGCIAGGGIVKSSPTPPSQLTLQETQIQRNACKNFIKKNVNKKISSIRILLRFFFIFRAMVGEILKFKVGQILVRR